MRLRDSISNYIEEEKQQEKKQENIKKKDSFVNKVKTFFKNIISLENLEEKYEDLIQKDRANIALTINSIEPALVIDCIHHKGAFVQGIRLSDSYFTKFIVHGKTIISANPDIYDSAIHRKGKIVNVNLRKIYYNNGETKEVILEVI